MKSSVFLILPGVVKSHKKTQNLLRRVSTRHLKVIPIQDMEPKIGLNKIQKVTNFTKKRYSLRQSLLIPSIYKGINRGRPHGEAT